MAQKLVGRKGRELAGDTVAGKGGRVLPKSRPSKKFDAAMYKLQWSLGVAFEGVPAPKDAYRLLNYLRYKWDGDKWSRVLRPYIIPDGFSFSRKDVNGWEWYKKAGVN